MSLYRITPAGPHLSLLGRSCELCGATHTRAIAATASKLTEWFLLERRGPHIQEFFPELSAEDREFVISGIPPEEREAVRLTEERDLEQPGSTCGPGCGWCGRCS